MKTISSLYLMLAMLFVAGMAVAQPGGGMNMDPKEMAARQTERMTADLGLDANQAASVGEINLKYAQLMAETRQQSGGDREAMRETMMGIRADKDAELKAVLTEAQFTKHAEMQQRGGPGGGQAGQGEGRKGQGNRGGNGKQKTNPEN